MIISSSRTYADPFAYSKPYQLADNSHRALGLVSYRLDNNIKVIIVDHLTMSKNLTLAQNPTNLTGRKYEFPCHETRTRRHFGFTCCR
ncbi:hypothetical protein EAF00_011081 [Botryotinia globosa]|nr:hypothetical protein EAF00_011081 [Botryotinia globosa]